MSEEQKAKKAFGKERRRSAQAQKVEQKNKENADYFWKCAQSEKRNREKGVYKKPSEASKEALFARQESSGINFSQVLPGAVACSSAHACIRPSCGNILFLGWPFISMRRLKSLDLDLKDVKISPKWTTS